MAGNRRVNLKAILADPDLRRELMVTTIQATQAREGIETTRTQAERAYYVVSEGERCAFFHLSSFRKGQGDHDRREHSFVGALSGQDKQVRFDVARRDFLTIEDSPFPYREIRLIPHVFRENVALEKGFGEVRQGLATSEDDRWLRRRWEVPKHRIGRASAWVPIDKGGDFCRFYYDFDLLIAWENNGKAIKQYIVAKDGSESKRIYSQEFYFQAGLTWPRAGSTLSVRVLPTGHIFSDKGPSIFLKSGADTWYLLGVLNTPAALFVANAFSSRPDMGARWEVGILKRLPVPAAPEPDRVHIASLAQSIHDAKAAWDEGNEISTRFRAPWLLRSDLIPDPTLPLPARLDLLATVEAREEGRIQTLYADLNDTVYRLYGITDHTRKIIEDTLGERPPEILWPQMEGQTPEQKRMEHVYRLLSHAVGSVLAEDQDGIVPFHGLSGETPLLDRLHLALARLLPGLDPVALDVDLTNELKRRGVKGYRPMDDLGAWLRDAFFEHHLELYKHRPIRWHLTSRADQKAAALDVLVDYHRFDKDRLRKLRAPYVKDAASHLRRESALAGNAGTADLRTWYSEQADEVDALDRKLQEIQEGKGSYAIGTPWKAADARPKGWDPDLDDGVKVNIAPFVAAGLLRTAKGL